MIDLDKNLFNHPYLAFVIVFFSACAMNAEDERPNIVFILVDDVRQDEVQEFEFVTLPNIDLLAREGASFQNFFTTSPLCSPSRAGFLTGKYPHTHGIVDNGERAAQSHKLRTFPLLMHETGYQTAFMGKWHMGHEDDSARPGFDYWISFEGQGKYFNPRLNVNGERLRKSGYTTDILNDYAAEFIRKADRPFLLYLSHKAVHPEIHPNRVRTFPSAPRHKKLYESVNIPHTPAAGVGTAGKPALERELDFDDPRSERTPEDDILNRIRMLHAVDEGIGQMLQMLRKKGELENTIFILTSDQGFFYGEFGLGQERRLAYEPSIKIPFIIRYPSMVKPGTQPEAIGLNIDVAPTLLELGGVSVPEDIQGKSLVPVLTDEKEIPFRDKFFIEYYTDEVFPRIYKMGYKAIRTKRYKYIQYTDLKGMDEFYDLDSDPYEIENVINDPGYDQEHRKLKESLDVYF